MHLAKLRNLIKKFDTILFLNILNHDRIAAPA